MSFKHSRIIAKSARRRKVLFALVVYIVLTAEATILRKRKFFFHLLFIAFGVMSNTSTLATLQFCHRIFDVSHSKGFFRLFKTILVYRKYWLTSSLFLTYDLLEPWARIGLATSSLPWKRSATELPRHFFVNTPNEVLWAGKDSNLRSHKATDLQSVVIDRSTTDPYEIIYNF